MVVPTNVIHMVRSENRRQTLQVLFSVLTSNTSCHVSLFPNAIPFIQNNNAQVHPPAPLRSPSPSPRHRITITASRQHPHPRSQKPVHIDLHPDAFGSPQACILPIMKNATASVKAVLAFLCFLE